MSKQYPDVDVGKWWMPTRVVRIMCCDCSLVHKITLRVKNGKIEWKHERDDRATSAARRASKFKKVGKHTIAKL